MTGSLLLFPQLPINPPIGLTNSLEVPFEETICRGVSFSSNPVYMISKTLLQKPTRYFQMR